MKKLKHLFPLLLCALAGAFSSCSDDNDDPKVTPEAALSVYEMNFEATPTEAQTLTVAANTGFTIESSADWCKLTHVEVGGNSEFVSTFMVSCEPNTSTDERYCTIKVSTEGQELASVSISQEGAITPLTVDMVYDALGLGWNLGNQMDAHIDGVADETSWGNPLASQQLFNAIKAAGFTSVRIPVTWMGHVGEAPEYTVEAAWLDRVAEIVGYAEKAGLKVIINMHHDGADSAYWLNIKKAATDEAANAAIEAQLSAIWTQVARKFADKGEFLVFEAMNEIHDGGWGWGANRSDGGKQYKTFNHWQQVFVDAVRATGGKNLRRWLAVPTYCTNIDLGANLTIPEDPSQRVIVAVHCYEPYDFTLAAKYSEWGHSGASGKKASSNEKTLVAEFDKVVNRWISKGIPVYIGEFGCVHRDTERSEAFRKYYLEYFAKAASDRKIPSVYWDNGYAGTGAEQSGLFDRTNGAFVNNSQDVINCMTRGFFSPTLTLDDIYNAAP